MKAKNKKNGKCATPYCRNKAYIFKAKGGDIVRFSRCNKCRQRRYRERNPVSAAYFNLKAHAKARGIEFDLTFEQFNVFCIQTGYDKLKGKTKECLTVDRIENELGYTVSNIRAIIMQENSFKGTRPYTQEECPF